MYLVKLSQGSYDDYFEKDVFITSDEQLAIDYCNKEKNPNFKKEVFEKKVKQHIKCGYTKELAEWTVLIDFNRVFNKRQTDINGYYI